MPRQRYSNLIAFAPLLLMAVFSGSSKIPRECQSVIDFNADEICCELPDESITEEELEILSDCVEFVRKELLTSSNDDKLSKMEENESLDITEEECIDECFYNKTGLLTKMKKLNEEFITKDFVKAFQDELWRPVVDDALSECFKQSPTFGNRSSKCNSGAYQMYICLMKEIYQHCPAEKWTDSESCRKEKVQVEKCTRYVI